MAPSLVFVGGIYGSGKSTLSRALSNRLGIAFCTASELIGHKGSGLGAASKAVESVTDNQAILVKQVALRFSTSCDRMILDGHYCVPNRHHQIEEVPLS